MKRYLVKTRELIKKKTDCKKAWYLTKQLGVLLPAVLVITVVLLIAVAAELLEQVAMI
jgi:hypothetical protein